MHPEREHRSSLPPIITYSREELIASPTYDPVTPRSALNRFLQTVAPIESIIGYSISESFEGLTATTYLREMGLGNIIDLRKEYEAQEEFKKTLEQLGYSPIYFTHINILGELSFEAGVQNDINQRLSLNEDEEELLQHGEIPAGMDVVDQVNYYAGFYELTAGPLLIKLD